MDIRMIEHLPNARPIYFVDELITMIDQADVVLSMRYHGCILAMLRGKRVFGLREQKCFDLLARYGNKLSFSTTVEADAYKGIEYYCPTRLLDEDRKIFLHELSKVLASIPRRSSESDRERRADESWQID